MITQAFIPTTKGLLLKYLVYIPLFTWFIVFLGFSNGSIATFIALCAVILTYVTFGLYDISKVLPRKSTRDNRIAELSKLYPKQQITTSTWGVGSPVLDSFKQEGIGRPYNQVKHADWQLTDYSYDRIVHTRAGDYVSGQCYITIIELTLPRRVPHMVFDSKNTHGKQMGTRFDDNQKMKLEGNFDTYFDTYYPAHYQIDALSIITPEVMETLINASKYDIEIFGHKLYLYSKMVSASEAATMIAKAQAIRTKLLNNIITYADNRLTSNRRSTVHTYGMTIQPDFKNKAIGLFFLGFICLALGLFGIVGVFHEFDLEMLTYSIVFIAIAVGSVKSGFTSIKKGRKERDDRRSVPRQ